MGVVAKYIGVTWVVGACAVQRCQRRCCPWVCVRVRANQYRCSGALISGFIC
jgi:hypothetical protein